jgi:hypothetical protein
MLVNGRAATKDRESTSVHRRGTWDGTQVGGWWCRSRVTSSSHRPQGTAVIRTAIGIGAALAALFGVPFQAVAWNGGEASSGAPAGTRPKPGPAAADAGPQAGSAHARSGRRPFRPKSWAAASRSKAEVRREISVPRERCGISPGRMSQVRSTGECRGRAQPCQSMSPTSAAEQCARLR